MPILSFTGITQLSKRLYSQAPLRLPFIGFIGGGNVASNLIVALLRSGQNGENIIVSDPVPEKLRVLQDKFNIIPADHNIDAAKQANILVLAVKPQLITSICPEIAEAVIEKRPLIISVTADISLRHLENYWGKDLSIVRSVPHIDAYTRQGTTALVANNAVTASQKKMTDAFFKEAYKTMWVKHEDEINAITTPVDPPTQQHVDTQNSEDDSKALPKLR